MQDWLDVVNAVRWMKMTLNANQKKEMPRPQNNSEEYLALLDSSQ